MVPTAVDVLKGWDLDQMDEHVKVTFTLVLFHGLRTLYQI